MTTLTHYTKKFVHYLRNNRAVSALEYALLLGIIAVAIAAALATLGTGIGSAIDKSEKSVKNKVTDAIIK